MDWEPLVGNPHVGGLIVLVVDVLSWGQQHSAGISQATRQPYLGRALPTPIRGGVDKRRPTQMPAPISTAVGNRACWGVLLSGRNIKKLKFACWNVRTLLDNPTSDRPARRTALLAMELSKYNIDVAALSETRFEGDGSLEETGLGYTFFWKGVPAGSNRIHGVGFAVKSCLLPSFQERPVGISERIMSWRLPLEKSRFATLFSVYAPTLVSPETDKDCFYDSLASELNRVPAADKIVLLGDFNARVGTKHDVWGGVMGRHGTGSCNDNGLRLLSLCSEYGLCITNTLFQLKDMHKTTWMHPRSKNWHILDYVIIKQRDRSDVHITRVMRGAELSTDHRLVVSQMALVIRPPVRKRTGKRKICVNKLQAETNRNTYQSHVAAAIGQTNFGNLYADAGPEETWSEFCKLLTDTATEELGTETRNHRDWFDESNDIIRKKLESKNKAHDSYLRNPTTTNKNAFTEQRREVQRALRTMENDWWLRYSDEMQGYFDKGDTHNFYNALKVAFGPSDKSLAPVRGTNGDLIKDKAGILSRWAEHFSDLLNRANPTDPTFIEAVPQLNIVEELDLPPTLDEVKKAICSLRCRKAAGLDGLQAELLKYGGDRVHEELFKYISACWSSDIIPSQWKDSKIIAIYKRKGDKTECGNSRGISLLSVGGKIYARLLLLRLIEHVSEKVLPESQCGFRKERSTTDMTFVLRLIQEKCREQHRDLFAVFVDLSKAFDTVDRELLWEVLGKFGCPTKFIGVIRAFHQEMNACVSAAGETSDFFGVLVGVKQGCVLAPVLFNLFVSAVLHVFHGSPGGENGIPVRYRYDGGGLFNLARLKARTKCNSVVVNELQYADDAAFVSHTAQGLQGSVSGVHSAYTRAGLNMNLTKTEVLAQCTGGSLESAAPQILVEDAELPVTDKFTYLGSIITSDCSLDEEVLRRIALASSAFGRLTHRVFLNHRLSLATKKSVYQAICLSILLFGCEAWALYRRHFRKLESFHGDCIQRILGLKWYHRVPRIESRKRIGMSTLEEIILRRQLRWAGHVARMPPGRLPRQVLYGELETGERSTGGQRKRYKDNLKRTMKQFNMDPTSLDLAAEDRTKWKQLVSNGASIFASAYDAAAVARRGRRHNPPTDGNHQCPECERRFVSLSGLRSHLRAHQRRRAADDGRIEGEEDVVIETDGHP